MILFRFILSLLLYLSNPSGLTNSFISTSSSFAIFSKVSILGWEVLVHHLEMVAGSFPSVSASHLLVLFFSTRTTFNLLTFAILSIILIFCKDSENLAIVMILYEFILFFWAIIQSNMLKCIYLVWYNIFYMGALLQYVTHG